MWYKKFITAQYNEEKTILQNKIQIVAFEIWSLCQKQNEQMELKLNELVEYLNSPEATKYIIKNTFSSKAQTRQTILNLIKESSGANYNIHIQLYNLIRSLLFD